MDHSLPPAPVLRSVIDSFFLALSDRPNAWVDRRSLKRKLDNGTLPRHLLLAVLACGVPVSTDPYYDGTKHEASEAYARVSWMLVSANEPATSENPTIEAVQTSLLLAIRDHTTGRVGSACEKVGLAARLTRALRLMVEPPSFLPFDEQEEMRRVFWLCYSLTRLVVCAKLPSLAFQDDECTLQLPCDEETFRAGEWACTQALNDLLTWDFQGDKGLNAPSLAVLMVSVLGRCRQYVHWGGHQSHMAPWDSNSEFSELTSLLLRMEAYFQTSNSSVATTLRNSVATSRANAGFDIWSRIIFHLCHCLINHPFVALQHSRPFSSRLASIKFAMRLLDTATSHARQLLDLVGLVCEAGGLSSESHLYPYWVVVAGGILSLVSHCKRSNTDAEASQYFNRSLLLLKQLDSTWFYSANMALNLHDFHVNHARTFAAFLDPTCSSEDIDPVAEQVVWTVLDHERIGLLVSKRSDTSGSHVPGSPSSIFGDLGSYQPFATNSMRLGAEYTIET
ncbi:fungal-specific transcription factor domain-containing protein [Aspergillus aurantiobrunneus]